MNKHTYIIATAAVPLPTLEGTRGQRWKLPTELDSGVTVRRGVIIIIIIIMIMIMIIMNNK